MFSTLLTYNLTGGHTTLWPDPVGTEPKLGAAARASCRLQSHRQIETPSKVCYFPRGLISLGKQPSGYLQVI